MASTRVHVLLAVTLLLCPLSYSSAMFGYGPQGGQQGPQGQHDQQGQQGQHGQQGQQGFSHDHSHDHHSRDTGTSFSFGSSGSSGFTGKSNSNSGNGNNNSISNGNGNINSNSGNGNINSTSNGTSYNDGRDDGNGWGYGSSGTYCLGMNTQQCVTSLTEKYRECKQRESRRDGSNSDETWNSDRGHQWSHTHKPPSQNLQTQAPPCHNERMNTMNRNGRRSTTTHRPATPATPLSPSKQEGKTVPNPTSQEAMHLDELPAWAQTAFLSVKQMVTKIIAREPRYRMSGIVVYDDITKLLQDPQLGSVARELIKDTPSGLWRTLQLVNGCCPLLKFHAANETLVNIKGVKRRIVHFDKRPVARYQFIQHGVCAPDINANRATTHRTCVQGLLPMPLLVWDTDYMPPFSFDLFDIPTHCTCLNT